MRVRIAGGFTLIEILVAVLVLAIGVIGAGGAQVAAMRQRHASSLLSQGVQLAASLAERMRANSVQMQRGDALNPYLQLRYHAAGGAPGAPAPLCFGADGCSSEQIARADLYDTALALHAGFPAGRVAVCRDAAIWDGGGARLSWDCAGGPGAPIVIKLGWSARRGAGQEQGQEQGQGAPALALVVAESAP